MALQGAPITSRHIFLSIILIFSTNLIDPLSAKTFSVHWNSSNPIFRIDNTDHVFDVNVGNSPQEYDQANILCPFYSTDQSNSSDLAVREQYIIYSVTREEYETCSIVTPNPRVVADCRTPHKPLYFTITFRTFTPSPGGLEFRPGQDYFFISTSDPDNPHKKSGGRCLSHNMRVVFKTAEQNNKKTATLDKSMSRQSPRDFDRTTTPRIDVEKTSPRPIVKSGDIVFVDNDVSKDSGTENRNIFDPDRKPSPKLDPMMYYPIRQADTDFTAGVNDVIISSDVAVVTSFRRQSRNEEDIRLEPSRMSDRTNAASVVFLADSFLIFVLASILSFAPFWPF